MPEWLHWLVVVVSFLISIAALMSSARLEGRKDQKIDTLEKDVDSLKTKFNIMESFFHSRDIEVATLKTDILYIRESLNEIKESLKKVIDRDV